MPSYINKIHAIHLPSREIKTPRARYQQYVNDLYTLYDATVSEQTFYEGGQYTYAELGDGLFQQEELSPLLRKLDMIIVAHWSQEFDPDYASCGPYFLQKYQLTADIFDVCDMGTVAPFMALKLLKDYQQTLASENAMVLCLEQDTIPRTLAAGDIVPSISGAVAVCVSATHTKNCLRIHDVGIYPEKMLRDNAHKFVDFFLGFIESYKLSISTIQLVLRKNTLPWKLINSAIHSHQLSIKPEQLLFIKPQIGCLSAMEAISQLNRVSCNYRNVVMLDEDVESLMMSFAIWGYEP
jgi:hypothetical protein